MAKYTADDLKDLTSVQAVGTWSDAKILLKQDAAETILAGLGLNSSAASYATAYPAAVVMVFDWLAANPEALANVSQGKVSKGFNLKDLPGPVQLCLKDCMLGGEYSSGIVGAKLQRSDIGLR
jgi:hypothetical protein